MAKPVAKEKAPGLTVFLAKYGKVSIKKLSKSDFLNRTFYNVLLNGKKVGVYSEVVSDNKVVEKWYRGSIPGYSSDAAILHFKKAWVRDDNHPTIPFP